jgi:hypothetical protein
MTNVSFVEAKQENRWLTVRLLWSNPAGRFGSIAGSHEGPLTGSRLLYLCCFNLGIAIQTS